MLVLLLFKFPYTFITNSKINVAKSDINNNVNVSTKDFKGRRTSII